MTEKFRDSHKGILMRCGLLLLYCQDIHRPGDKHSCVKGKERKGRIFI